ncbi:hypothetical protein LCGC14_2416050, partial [marine sediment metagenome]
PHTFGWNLGGHTGRVYVPPVDVTLGQSLPAFTRCSLDDDPGTATKLAKPKEYKDGKYTRKDRYDGVPYGQFNAYLAWRTDGLIDQADRWEITVYLTAGKRGAPKDECTVDITPRRLQELSIKPGEKFTWTNVEGSRLAGAVSGGKAVQSGQAVADKHGLVTLEKVTVTKVRNRIKLRRAK